MEGRHFAPVHSGGAQTIVLSRSTYPFAWWSVTAQSPPLYPYAQSHFGSTTQFPRTSTHPHLPPTARAGANPSEKSPASAKEGGITYAPVWSTKPTSPPSHLRPSPPRSTTGSDGSGHRATLRPEVLIHQYVQSLPVSASMRASSLPGNESLPTRARPSALKLCALSNLGVITHDPSGPM